MKSFKQHILEKLKVTTRNSYNDPQVIWDKILNHEFFIRNHRFQLERIYGDNLPEVNQDNNIPDNFKGKFKYFEVGTNQDKYMAITLDRYDGNFTFKIQKVKLFLELFGIEVLKEILEYLNYLTTKE